MLYLLLGTHDDKETLYVNAATCTLKYRPTNPPIVIDLPFNREERPVVVNLEELKAAQKQGLAPEHPNVFNVNP
jgi:hypothetical protein